MVLWGMLEQEAKSNDRAAINAVLRKRLAPLQKQISAATGLIAFLERRVDHEAGTGLYITSSFGIEDEILHIGLITPTTSLPTIQLQGQAERGFDYLIHDVKKPHSTSIRRPVPSRSGAGSSRRNRF